MLSKDRGLTGRGIVSAIFYKLGIYLVRASKIGITRSEIKNLKINIRPSNKIMLSFFDGCFVNEMELSDFMRSSKIANITHEDALILIHEVSAYIQKPYSYSIIQSKDSELYNVYENDCLIYENLNLSNILKLNEIIRSLDEQSIAIIQKEIEKRTSKKHRPNLKIIK